MDCNGQLFHQGRLSSLAAVRQWCVSATPLTQADCLVLNAIPLTSADSSMQKQQDGSQSTSGPPAILGHQVLSCRLQFPQPIIDVQFYSDDGRSSFPNPKEAFGKEGDRQKLGVLLQQSTMPSTGQDLAVELWLLRYDDLPFEILPCKADPVGPDNNETTITIQSDQYRSFPIPVTPLLNNANAEDNSNPKFSGSSVTAWTRSVTLKRGQSSADTGKTSTSVPSSPSSTTMNSPTNISNNNNYHHHHYSGHHPKTARLLLNGSRGVGAVHAATNTSGSTLEIFDLEDHDNSDNESDDADNNDNDEEDDDVDTSMEVD
jgi:hypothetical protein